MMICSKIVKKTKNDILFSKKEYFLENNGTSVLTE